MFTKKIDRKAGTTHLILTEPVTSADLSLAEKAKARCEKAGKYLADTVVTFSKQELVYAKK